jgi:hypothetical protein
MSLQIELVKSKFANMATIEQIPLTVLNKLISSEHIKPATEEWNEKAQLCGIKKLVKYNKLNVKYEVSELGIGRVFPHKSLGYCNMRRELRHTLADNYYIDIDIVNCHPSILYQLCEKNKIICKRLKYYVNNRSEVIKQIILENDQLNLSEDDIKNHIIYILYGNTKTPLKCDFIDDLIMEIIAITKYFTDANKELYKLIEKSKKKKKKHLNNLEGSLLSIVLQYYENKILEIIYDFLISKNVIINNNCVLCFDGIMIPRDKQYAAMLNELEDEINNKIQFNIKLKIKPMDQIYKDLHDIEDDYDKIKEEFEFNHFKLKNPISYCEITEDLSLVVRQKKDFIDVYQNKHLMDYEHNKKVSFVNTWMNDPDILTYDRIDFLPCIKAPSHIYNSFNGFEINKYITNDGDNNNDDAFTLSFDDNDDTDKNLDIKQSYIYKHLFNLCGCNDEVLSYVLYFLSRKVKNPTILTNTALLFKSKQGAGKDMFFNWFGYHILGEKYYYNNSNTEMIFGKFNNELKNKILVIVNESSGSKNFKITEDIKDRITNKKNLIEPKGHNPVGQKNCISYIYFSNNDNPLQIAQDDRRFVAIECNNEICNNSEYFTNLDDEIKNKKYNILFYKYLLSLDSDTYDFTNKRPNTNLYTDMKEANKPIIYLFIEYLINLHNIKANNNTETCNIETITACKLFDLFSDFISRHNFKCDLNSTKFGLKLKEFSKEIVKNHTSTGNKYSIDYKQLEQLFIMKGYIKYDNSAVNTQI